LKQLQDSFPVEIPFLEFGNTTDEMKESLDSYIYIKDSDGFKEIFQGIISKYPQIQFTHLGTIPGSDVCSFMDTCEEHVTDSITEGLYYKLTKGNLQGLVLRAEGIEDDKFIGTYMILGRDREIRVPVGDVKYVKNYPYEKQDSHFLDYVGKAQKMGFKKAIIIDGDNVLYRNIFGYNKMYTTRTRKFVGGAFGFYFTMLKLKELFVEYELHVVFDGYPEEKFDENPHYKANRVKKSNRFRDAYKSNRKWVQDFVRASGFNLYLMGGEEADDIIGSLATHLAKDKGYQHVFIYATDNDFYQLVDDQIHIYQPKVSFRGHSEKITQTEVLKKFKVGDVKKINWFRALKGDTSDNIPSINTYYSSIGYDSFVIKSSEYLPMIKEADSLLELYSLMLKNERIKKFIEDKQFQRNLKLLTINTEIPLDPISDFSNEFDDEKCQDLLQDNCFFKELEMWGRNSRIFKGLW